MTPAVPPAIPGYRLLRPLGLVDGEDLAVALARRGRLPWREAVAHVAAVADGLAHLHAAGVVQCEPRVRHHRSEILRVRCMLTRGGDEDRVELGPRTQAPSPPAPGGG